MPRPDPRIAGLLKTRADAIAAGDMNVARACTVELAGHGYHDDEPTLETTAAARLPERPTAPRAASRKGPR